MPLGRVVVGADEESGGASGAIFVPGMSAAVDLRPPKEGGGGTKRACCRPLWLEGKPEAKYSTYPDIGYMYEVLRIIRYGYSEYVLREVVKS